VGLLRAATAAAVVTAAAVATVVVAAAVAIDSQVGGLGLERLSANLTKLPTGSRLALAFVRRFSTL